MQQDLSERQQKILNAIINEFQRSAEPVGSRSISKNHFPDLSPATIRNEMADLEDEGFITQPHTSAGRIPTDRGYRFYVNHLMRASHPTPREEEQIKHTLSHSQQNLDDILHQTARLLSHALDYTAIVINLGHHRRIYAAGTVNLLHQPEFRNLAHMQKMLQLFEEEELLAEIVDEGATKEEVSVHIGLENKHKIIRDCSLIVSSYEVEHENIGRIGVIGPTRMYYSKTTALVNYVAKELSKVLNTGKKHEI
jgi:transcriptional regulator of heat shock response